MNILFCSVGRRAELLKYFKETLGESVYIVATDLSEFAPALYFADKTYLAPRITDETYLDFILDKIFYCHLIFKLSIDITYENYRLFYKQLLEF